MIDSPWITIVAGQLSALITLFTSYSHGDFPGFGALPIDQQIGVPPLLASLTTLVVAAELTTRRRAQRLA